MNYEVGQLLYRADVDGSYVRYTEYEVVSLTAKGAYIAMHENFVGPKDPLQYIAAYAVWSDNRKVRWIGLHSRFAWRTKEEAFVSLERRATSYVFHCTRRLAEAERRLDVLKRGVHECPSIQITAFSWLKTKTG